MPRFFFDIDDSVGVRDGEGQELVDLDAARTEAFRRAAEYGGNPANLRSSGITVVTVRDGLEAAIPKVRLVCQVDDYHLAMSGSLSHAP